MASVFTRGGTKNFYARFKDASGKWRSRRTAQENKKDALRVARQLEAQAERQRLGLEAPTPAVVSCGGLLERWQAGLVNRSARADRYRIARHIVPRFGALLVSDLTLAAVMLWLDDMMAGAAMTAGSLRHLLNLLSRFCSWCVARGYMPSNPVKAVPSGRRPQASRRTDVPWIADDAVVARAMELLPEPVRYLFFLGNRCGLRTGEACGLRMSDLDEMGAGTIRVRFSYLGPLKEDKAGVGLTKYVPAPVDCADVLGPWLAWRASEGARGDDLVFPRAGRSPMRKEQCEHAWRRVRGQLSTGAMTWYQATRHSFASRNLAAGVSMDEVSQALGHSSVAVTQRHYAHFVRRTFAPAMTAPIGNAHVSPIAEIANDGALLSPPARKARTQRPIGVGGGAT